MMIIPMDKSTSKLMLLQTVMLLGWTMTAQNAVTPSRQFSLTHCVRTPHANTKRLADM